MNNTVKKVTASVITLALTATIAVSSLAGVSAKETKKTNHKKFTLSLHQLEKRAKIYYTTTEPGAGINRLSIKAKSINSKKAVVKIYRVVKGKKSIAEKYTVKKSNGIGKSTSGEKVDLGNPNPYALRSGTYISSNGKFYEYLTINNLTNKAWFWCPALGDHTTAKFTFGKDHTYSLKFAPDCIYTAKASNVDETGGRLVFSEGHTPSNYTLVSKLTDNFSFYNNAQLKNMALKHFKAINHAGGSYKVSIESAKYGCVTIKIYKSSNGNTSIRERYTINRIGGTGFNSKGSKVDLNKFA